ncbi:hypothetical protein G9C85_14170 [Halorubellus sp. JP-L1]|uniref:hypothetical protein n=1 Tax=Halorubellus sp. JP-L1 TaxID=2715753 RepID=UPI00140B34E0|nr:hypothetical protein [Halorubellus sp. JP-L1]NHN42768.1 hypothetical protein [Halorubellus sp. JP-L1]
MSDRPSPLVDAAEVREDDAEIRADAAEVRDEQVARALRRLDEHGELTAEKRAVVERLADRITAEVDDLFDADALS